MNFPENIRVTEITHILTINYKKNERVKMENRPWYGIVFSFDGEISCVYGSKKIQIKGNQAVFIPKNSTYTMICTKSGSFAIINFLTANELDIDELIDIQIENEDFFQTEISIMHSRFISGVPKNAYKNLSSLYTIFSILESSLFENKFPFVLNTALSYIDKNIASSTLCNAQISNYVGISEVYLRKLFSHNLSISVNQYIQNKRIEMAKKLLFETSLSITDVSEKCGYSCIYYFCKAFKHKTGYTPTQYRNKNYKILF